MKVIVGLGNPGEKYEKTRHNLGYIVLDQLLEKLEPHDKTFWDDNHDLKAHIKKVRLNPPASQARALRAGTQDLRSNNDERITNNEILLVKPATFMNNSGFAVAKVLNYFKVKPQDCYLIHDELDLPFGKIRVRFGGGAGGHHGVESVVEHIGDKFLRVRLGIGTDKVHETRREHTDKYVLGVISSKEKGKVKTMTREAIKILELILEHGIDTYMSKHNR